MNVLSYIVGTAEADSTKQDQPECPDPEQPAAASASAASAHGKPLWTIVAFLF